MTNTAFPRFPSLKKVEKEDQTTLQEWWAKFVHILHINEQQGFAASKSPYSATNVSVSRTINCATATTSVVANVLGTLITDLKKAGYLS